MNILGVDFTISDLVLLGIAGGIVIFLVANRLVGGRKKEEN